MYQERESEGCLTEDQRETRNKFLSGCNLIVHVGRDIKISLTLLFVMLLLLSGTGLCDAKDVPDCEQPAIDFPVQFTNYDKPNTKEFLAKVIRKLVISGNQYIEDTSPDFRVGPLSDILAKEYNCETGTTLNTKETKELITILKHIYIDVLRKGEVTPLTGDELTSLLDGLKGRGTYTSKCCTAISDMVKMMTTTIRESVKEKIDYENRLQQRSARIEQCRKVALAQEQKTKAEIEMKRKQEALEHQIVEEKKFAADVNRKKGVLELERQEKESQKDQKLKAAAEALEHHQKTMALEKAREDQLKSESEALKRETAKLERAQNELSAKLEKQRQLELEKDRQRALQDQMEKDRERQAKLDRQSQLKEVQERQRTIDERLFAEREHQSKVRKALEETRRVQDLKSDNIQVSSFRDAELKYEPINGYDYVDRPPTAKPNEERYLLLSGTIESQDEDVIICGVPSQYDSLADRIKIRKWGLMVQGIGSYVPRIGEQIRAIGKIYDVKKGITVSGIPIYMIVVQAVALETQSGQFLTTDKKNY